MTSQYLEFREADNSGRKTKRFHIYNKRTNEFLGTIQFLGAWRRYVVNPRKDIIFDSVCLDDISTFLKELTAEWKESLKNEK